MVQINTDVLSAAVSWLQEEGFMRSVRSGLSVGTRSLLETSLPRGKWVNAIYLVEILDQLGRRYGVESVRRMAFSATSDLLLLTLEPAPLQGVTPYEALARGRHLLERALRGADFVVEGLDEQTLRCRFVAPGLRVTDTSAEALGGVLGAVLAYCRVSGWTLVEGVETGPRVTTTNVLCNWVPVAA